MEQTNDDPAAYVLKRYNEVINYYWKASRNNKCFYKLTRIFTVILGALVTLVASLSSAEFITEITFWNYVFKLGTPFLAATLTIISGVSQSFQWGAAWQDMVLTAQLLEKERDRFMMMKPEDRELVREMELLNDFVLVESQSFFARMLGSSRAINKEVNGIQIQLGDELKDRADGRRGTDGK